MLGVGSVPILKKQVIGVSGRDSACSTSTRLTTGSEYFEPRELLIYFLDWDNVLSVHQAL